MSETGPSRPTVLVHFNVFSDTFARLQEQASLRGLSSTDAIGQALALWAKISEGGMVGGDQAVYVCREAPPTRWQDFLLKYLGIRIKQKVMVVVAVSLPGDSIDITLSRLLEEE